MQHALQAGLSAGMSATSGFHSNSPTKVDSSFDGTAALLPQDYIPQQSSRITYRGKHQNVEAPVISWGAWSWGDTSTWHWKDEERGAVDEGWKLCKQTKQIFIDTAQAYGSGKSEEICGELFRGMKRDEFVVQTKWYVVPDNLTNLSSDAPEKYLRDSLKRMSLDYVDIYLVHGHIHMRSIASVAKSLANCVANKLTKCVGVANYSADDMLQMRDELAKYDVPLAVNQVEFNVLRRNPETSGLLQTCEKEGIVMQSYSSLAQGRLTGKYSKDREPPKSYRFSQYPMEELEGTIKVLEKIARERKVATSAVALNYNISKGVAPVVGFRNPAQVEQNIGCLGWRLSVEEIKTIDEVSLEGRKTILWQQG